MHNMHNTHKNISAPRSLRSSYHQRTNRNITIILSLSFSLSAGSLFLSLFVSFFLSFLLSFFLSFVVSFLLFISLFFTYITANLGLVLLIYLYSIHRAICRPSDHSVRRPRAEIRNRDGRIYSGRDTRPPHLR